MKVFRETNLCGAPQSFCALCMPRAGPGLSSVKDVQLCHISARTECISILIEIIWSNSITCELNEQIQKFQLCSIFSDLLITAAHHDIVVLRNVSLSSSDKPQHSNSTETIIKDNKVVLDCTVKANPAPTYTWDHLEEKNSSSVLNSSTLSPGNYTCTATNYLGRDRKVFFVESTGQF